MLHAPSHEVEWIDPLVDPEQEMTDMNILAEKVGLSVPKSGMDPWRMTGEP